MALGGLVRSLTRTVPILLVMVACGPRTDLEPRNVLVLSIDTLSRSALRAFEPSAPDQPALDGFARESVRFENALSTSSWTLPAHGSLLTGLYPDRHGATDGRVTLSSEVATLAEAAAAVGYETVAFTEGGFVHRQFGLARGFERYDEWVARDAVPAAVELPRAGAASNEAGEVPFDRALAYLRGRDPDARPFLMFLHTHSLHHYYLGRPWAVQALSPAPPAPAQRYGPCVVGMRRCPDVVWRELETLYQVELARMDAAFRELLRVLDQRGLRDSTLLILVSDHGEGFEPARNRIHHGGRLHEDQVRIPLLMRVPGRSGRSVAAPVSLVDLMPTAMEWIGVPVPDGLDGRSLWPLIRGDGEMSARALYAMEHGMLWHRGRRFTTPKVTARAHAMAVIQDGRWYITDRGREQLYDMVSDPRQTENLARGGAEPLDHWRQLADGRRRDRPQTALAETDEDLEGQLRALGYVE